MNILLLSYIMSAYCVRLNCIYNNNNNNNNNWMEDGRDTLKKYIKGFWIIHWTLRLKIKFFFFFGE